MSSPMALRSVHRTRATPHFAVSLVRRDEPGPWCLEPNHSRRRSRLSHPVTGETGKLPILVHGLVRTSRGPHTMCDPPGVSVTHGVLWGCSHEAVQHLQRPRASRVL